MKALLDLLRDDAWNGISGLVAVAGAIMILVRHALRYVPHVLDWLYDQYYEHVHWRLTPPREGLARASLRVKVVGVVKVRPDGSRVVERFD